MSAATPLQFLRHSSTQSLSLFSAIFCLALLPKTTSGQDVGNSGWLPKTLTESYSESLATASHYILTREGCDRLLEAKLSENSTPDNPKFILTCANEQNATANFVYWQSDVDSGFAADTYPEKIQDEDSTETLTEHQARLKLLTDYADLIANCRGHLQDRLLDRELVLEDSDIDVNQRAEQPVSVSLRYQVGKGDYAPKFSAICRRDSFGELNLRIFPAQ